MAYSTKLGAVVLGACFAVGACDSSGSVAQLARAPDVASCQSMGETTIEIDPSKSDDDHTLALRQKAAQQGATHVISEGIAGTTMKGQMYKCAAQGTENDHLSAVPHGGF